MSREKYPHYYKFCPYEYIDVYRVLGLFDVTDQAVGHAIKKLLAAGNRGQKNFEKDISEAIDTLNRKLEMMKEEPPYCPEFISTNSDTFYTGDKEDLQFTMYADKGKDGKEWPDTMDAVIWAQEFNKRFPSVPVDDALGWFANAIMRGYDQKNWDSDEYKKEMVDFLLKTEPQERIDNTQRHVDIKPDGCYTEIGPTDSFGPLPKAVRELPVLTEEEMENIYKYMRDSGDKI